MTRYFCPSRIRVLASTLQSRLLFLNASTVADPKLWGLPALAWDWRSVAPSSMLTGDRSELQVNRVGAQSSPSRCQKPMSMIESLPRTVELRTDTLTRSEE